MSTSYDEYAADMAIADLHDEAVMVRAAREQAIFVFVEGDSEETALPMLFTDILDLDAVGIRIANYNGHGNLKAALRLVKVILGHERPIVVTHDNDPQTIVSLRQCDRQNLLGEQVYVFPIPAELVVTYSCGHVGGSFEESFPAEVFLRAAFREGILPSEVLADRDSFESRFTQCRPWLKQLQRFVAEHNFPDWQLNKPSLAEALAIECDDLPSTFTQLASLIREVRARHPVVHPDDVQLPRVLGLTHFPKKRD